MLSVFVLRLASFGLIVLTIACAEKPQNAFKLSGATMGTHYNVTVVDPEGVMDASNIQQLIDQRLAVLNQQMSTYIESSELSLLNHAAVGVPVAIAPELFHVLLLSIETSWLTNGAFDVTVAPLVNLWGFGSTGVRSVVPSQSAIDKALAHVGYNHIELNLATVQLTKKQPISIDLSSIAKGYAVDQLSSLLSKQGASDFMVEVGGEIYTAGLNPTRRPWRIAIEQPDAVLGGVHRAISLSNKAVATSGDYRNYFERDGKRYSHTISPQTGRPIVHNLASVTVVSESAAEADALATGLNVMGSEKALALAVQQGLAIYLIVNSPEGFEVKYSDAFKPYLD